MLKNTNLSDFFNDSGSLNELGISYIAEQKINRKKLDKRLARHLLSNPQDQKEVNSLMNFLLEEKVYQQRKKLNYYHYISLAATIFALFFTYLYFIKSEYKLNSELEYLLDSKQRSNSITVYYPKNNAVINTAFIEFSFAFQANEALSLTIMDHNGDEKLKQMITKPIFKIPHKLDNSVYYWKLESSDELIYIGKFIIEI